MSILSSTFVRREVRHVFFVAMEIAWIAALLSLLDVTTGGPERPATLWCLWLYPATYVYARLEPRLAVRPVGLVLGRLAIGAAAGLATLGWIVRPVLPHIGTPSGDNWVLVLASLGTIGAGPVILVAVACVFAMARGWLLGPRRIDGDGFLAAFQAGILALFAVAFLRQVAGLPTGGTVVDTGLFLAFGLYGLWLTRWLDSDFAARRAGNAGWPVLAAAIVALILVAGVIVGNGVDHAVIDWLLMPVVWLIHMIGRFLVFLMSLLPDWEPPGDLPVLPAPKIAPPPSYHPNRFGEITHAIGAVMFTTAMGFLFAMLIVRNLGDLLRWLSRRRTRAPGIVHESSDFGFIDDLRALLAALRAAVGRFARRLARLWRWRRTASPSSVRAVRDTYARLLRWAAKRGRPRAAGQTPHEYLDVLRGRAPQLDADLAAITDAYVAVRYGAAVPSPDQLAVVRDGWRRIRRTRKLPR